MTTRISNKVIIIGGGISGLAAAYGAIQDGKKPIICEASYRLGGMIQTIQTDFGLVERAANGLLLSKPLERMFSKIGLSPIPHLKDSKKRFFWYKDKVSQLPLSFLDIGRFLFGAIFLNCQPTEREDMKDWSSRIFGSNFTNQFLEPAIGGVYASPLNLMDPNCAFPEILKSSNRSLLNRLFRIRWNRKINYKPQYVGSVSFEGGMQSLIDHLALYIHKHGEIRFGQSKLNLTNLRKEFPQTEIIISLPIQSLYHILQSDPWSKVFLDEYKVTKVPTTSIATVTRFSKDRLLKKKGFGILFPRNSNILANGVLFNDHIFPNRTIDPSIHSETWIYSGDAIREFTTHQINDLVEKDRKCIHNSNFPALGSFCQKWENALPVYGKELIKLNSCLNNIELETKRAKRPIRFIGNYRSGIGLRSIIDLALK
ncbi:protoporphyrinogen/coproporphyrinogen oxidase [Leptospira sp. GIMC2001]|uniref:protoporphyrinogen/coproporphyrinogen oxidase n=1 Tax=Leptospira sp. GIMC2001 TaxID=1513297 RepID=UPI00234B0320|nr:FAD-dependent oxidoreductase [Leptospira sp. GIMC2001]WCL49390.1 FAD-dependent oxidoreductase [Leptospira sp. GIMC2001]